MNTEILFLVSEVLLLVSYTMTKMIMLRLFICIANANYMIASYLAGFDAPGMTVTFSFSLLGIMINVLHLYRLIYAQIPTTIPNKYKTAYERYFTALTQREFKILLNYAKENAINNYLIRENEKTNLFLTLNGTVEVIKNDQIILKLGPYSILGEISFLTNDNSISAVRACGEVRVCEWDRATLQKIEKKYPNIFYKFYNILLKEIASKLARQNKNFLEFVEK